MANSLRKRKKEAVTSGIRIFENPEFGNIRTERTVIMCTINLKNASQKIMLATAVKREIKNWQVYK